MFYIKFESLFNLSIVEAQTEPRVTVKTSLAQVFSTNSEDQSSIANNECATLSCYGKSSPICVYGKEEDIYVSVQIRNSGCWERELVSPFMKTLKSIADVVVLDLGCNIGVFTITAAVEGYKVIGVDPVAKNLNLLSKSLRLGKLPGNVTLIWNAVSDTPGQMVLWEAKGNVGGTSVGALQKDGNSGVDLNDTQTVLAITLDDLIPFFDKRPIGIKMDIENSEYNALNGGRNFISQLDVRFIMMEWMSHEGKESGKGIVDIMANFSFSPFSAYNMQRLEVGSGQKWPHNVMWQRT